MTPSSKETYIEIVDDYETAKEIFDRALSLFKDNPDSLPVFKDASEEDILDVLYDAIEKASNYFIFAFYDTETDELVGACLLSTGHPWYNKSLYVLEEECTVSFKKGYGISYKVAHLLKKFLKNDDVDIVQAASAQEWSSKIIENSYTKEGFKNYNTYYLTKYDINGD